MNRVILLGNLTRDPEVRNAGSSVVANYTIAVNYFVGKGDEKVKETNFFNLESWGKTAELVGRILSKGDKVLIDGELRQDVWEIDGQKRSAVKIRVNNFDKLSWKDKDKDVTPQDENSESVSPESELVETIAGSDIPF